MVERIAGLHGEATVVEVAQNVWRAQVVGAKASVDFGSAAAARLWASLACGLFSSPREAVAAGAAGA
ncbi:hypothetical protein AAK967_04850 [Atopobiaceae bacterium 24-176]